MSASADHALEQWHALSYMREPRDDPIPVRVTRRIFKAHLDCRPNAASIWRHPLYDIALRQGGGHLLLGGAAIADESF